MKQSVYKYSTPNGSIIDAFEKMQEKAKDGYTIQTITSLGDNLIVVYNAPVSIVNSIEPPY